MSMTLTHALHLLDNARAAEAQATTERLLAEKTLLAIVGELPTEGTTRHSDGELVAVIQTGVRRKVDADKLAEIAGQIPEAIGKRLLRWKPELVTAELRYVQNNEPDIYRALSEAITVTPSKPAIRIEAAKQEEAA